MIIGGQIRTFGILRTAKVFNSLPGPDSLSKINYKTAAVLLACTAALDGRTPLLYTSFPPSFQPQPKKRKETVTALMGGIVLCCVPEHGRDRLDVSTTHYTVL